MAATEKLSYRQISEIVCFKPNFTSTTATLRKVGITFAEDGVQSQHTLNCKIVCHNLAADSEIDA